MKRTALTLAIATLLYFGRWMRVPTRKDGDRGDASGADVAPVPACGCDPCASGGMPAYGGATFAQTGHQCTSQCRWARLVPSR